MRHRLTLVALTALSVAFLAACSTYREGESTPDGQKVSLSQGAQNAIQDFRQRDPSLQRFFDSAYGYAVFPAVVKGGAGIGGAGGDGAVWEQGRLVGYSTLSQATIGPQLGGQKYREVIFFQNKLAMDEFKQGNTNFAASASAVAAANGAAANADYKQGVAVFTIPVTGLMFEAAIGGQKFSFRPVNEGDWRHNSNPNQVQP